MLSCSATYRFTIKSDEEYVKAQKLLDAFNCEYGICDKDKNTLLFHDTRTLAGLKRVLDEFSKG